MNSETTTDQPRSSPTESDGLDDERRTRHEGVFTESWYEQTEVEHRIDLIRQANGPNKKIELQREKHVTWLNRCLYHLPKGYDAFEAVQGWVAFWILHSLDLLGAVLSEEDSSLVVDHLRAFRDPEGGYGGGPGQRAHLVSSFSVVMALCALGTDEALASIDRDGLERFLCSRKQEDGSFSVSDEGETDVRAMYCAVSMASLLGILDGRNGPLLRKNCDKYLTSLQAFDGGLGGEPGAEAHGGHTYCGLASAVILGIDPVNVDSVIDWAVMRQMSFEGGFQGRTNKLVDSCYSFWIGSLFPLLAMDCKRVEIASLFDAEALQRYILECCQLPNGGLRDKPGVARDVMHTCYALSGLSVAQHFGKLENKDVKRTNPMFNLCDEKFEAAWKWFRKSS